MNIFVGTIAPAMSLDRAVLTDHARSQMKRRQIDETDVRDVLAKPERETILRPGRSVYQGIVVAESSGRRYLLRVFVDTDAEPPLIVTVCRTSRIAKFAGAP